MSFNFAAAKEAASKALNSKTLGAIILGPSGAGKSYLCGTLPGKILYLFSDGELHGAIAAQVNGGDVTAVRMDQDDEGKKLNADDSYARVLQILGATDAIVDAKFQSIVIDSLSELEGIIRSTSIFKKKCENSVGKHNNFAEPGVTLELLRPVLSKLRDLSLQHGIHYAATCPLTVSSIADDGQILESSPRLSGYSVAENVILQFGDVLVVGQVTKAGKSGHCLQFTSGTVTKQSKDLSGQVKKLVNFNPRITGVKNPPQLLPANLTKVIELKEAANASKN